MKSFLTPVTPLIGPGDTLVHWAAQEMTTLSGSSHSPHREFLATLNLKAFAFLTLSILFPDTLSLGHVWLRPSFLSSVSFLYSVFLFYF